jgi:uncharacterized coiled-coil DUF342 family protein
MPVFNDIGKKISQTGQDAVKKTKDMIETGKLNTQINDEKKKIANLYQKIGKMYFELFSAIPDERFADACAQIKESMRSIDEWRAEANRLKGIAACPACGAENAVSANFCNFCGARMAKMDEES